jgi:hypothetical protein
MFSRSLYMNQVKHIFDNHHSWRLPKSQPWKPKYITPLACMNEIWLKESHMKNEMHHSIYIANPHALKWRSLALPNALALALSPTPTMPRSLAPCSPRFEVGARMAPPSNCQIKSVDPSWLRVVARGICWSSRRTST